jgi:glucose-1-phosphate thymidylyltransferase
MPKMLLPVGGRPVLDWLWDRVQEVPDLEATHLVTNSRFAPAFREWAQERHVEVHDDGTTSNDDRLGAIGDIQLVIDRAGLEGSDLLVAAADNLFDFSLREYVEWWRGKEEGSSAVTVYDVEDRDLVRQYSVVELEGDGRVLSFVEKPENPSSTLAATATYLYDRGHVGLVRTYLDEGNTPDAPGNFVAWLHRRARVYGYRIPGEWIDIGDEGQLLDADNRLRRRSGLPERETYSLDTN